MMGFLQLLIGQDRYSINSSKVPDSKLPDSARTAILMPIWFVVTHVIGYGAIELSIAAFLGWALPFLTGAGGSLASRPPKR